MHSKRSVQTLPLTRRLSQDSRIISVGSNPYGGNYTLPLAAALPGAHRGGGFVCILLVQSLVLCISSARGELLRQGAGVAYFQPPTDAALRTSCLPPPRRRVVEVVRHGGGRLAEGELPSSERLNATRRGAAAVNDRDYTYIHSHVVRTQPLATYIRTHGRAHVNSHAHDTRAARTCIGIYIFVPNTRR